MDLLEDFVYKKKEKTRIKILSQSLVKTFIYKLLHRLSKY